MCKKDKYSPISPNKNLGRKDRTDNKKNIGLLNHPRSPLPGTPKLRGDICKQRGLKANATETRSPKNTGPQIPMEKQPFAPSA